MTAHALQTDDYASLCEKVRLLCGVDLMQYKRGQMERRVRTWVQRRGAASLPVYGDLLRRDPDELDAFLDRVTINVSHLWRHEEQWDALQRDVLPDIARRTIACAPGAPAARTGPRRSRSPPSAARPCRTSPPASSAPTWTDA